MIAGVSITTLLLVLVAGIGAGFVGYAVGASSLISYPALLAFGIPPVLSNTTNTVGVCGTGIGGLLSARKELKGQGRRVAVYACIGLVGGIIGGLLLLELPAKVFEFAVPPLILFSALIIALNPRKKAAARDAVAQALPQSHQGEPAIFRRTSCAPPLCSPASSSPRNSAGAPTCDMRCTLIRKVKSRWKNRFLQRISFSSCLAIEGPASRPSVSRKTASCQISVDSARMTMSTSLFSNSRMTCR